MAANITPTAGAVYSFKFQPGYTFFDGVYKVVKIMTYDEFAADGGNIILKFFEPCGKTPDEILAEEATVRASKILKLEHVNNLDEKDPYYVPLCYVSDTPDHQVKPYYHIGVICTLGVTEEPQDLDFAVATVTEQFEAVLGITPDPRFVTIQEMWLTAAEYKEILANRDIAKKRVINYYSECNRLQDQISRLKTTLASYEEIMIKQHKQLESLLAERVPEEES